MAGSVTHLLTMYTTYQYQINSFTVYLADKVQFLS